MLVARLLLAAALAIAAPAAQAQSADRSPIAVVGEWAGKFAAANAEPNQAVATCAPELDAAMAAMRDAASARTVLARIRPCLVRTREAYQRLAAALDALPPLPEGVEAAAKFDSRGFIAAQRRLVTATIAYFDSIERLAGAIADGDRAAAATLRQQVRTGGAALAEGSILQMRLFQATSQFDFTKSALELRIIVAEAGKLLMSGPISSAGVAAGEGLGRLSARATTAAAAARTGWQNDKAKIAVLRGSQPHSEVDGVVAAIDPVVVTVAASGEQLAALLRKAGGQPVMSFAATIQLANELNAFETAVAQAGVKFTNTLKTIG